MGFKPELSSFNLKKQCNVCAEVLAIQIEMKIPY